MKKIKSVTPSGLVYIIITLMVIISLVSCTGTTTSISETPSQEGTESSIPIPTQTQKLKTPTPKASQTMIDIDPQSIAGTSIRFLHAWPGEAGEVLADIATKFSLSNPWDIWVDVVAYGNENLLLEDIETNLAKGDVPALIAVHPYALSLLEGTYSTIDLTNYLNYPEWGFSPEDLADIPQVYLDQFTSDDHLMALPIAPQATALFYNQTWAQELGFGSRPVDENSFSDQSCEATSANLNDRDEDNDFTGGWLMNYDPAVLLSWYYAFGGSLSGNELPQFNNEAGQSAFGYLESLYSPSEGCIWVGRQSEPYQYFANRYALMYAGSLDQIPVQMGWMEQAGSHDTWVVMGFPGPEGEVMLVDGPGMFIAESTPEKQLAAWLFAKHLLTPEVQAKLVQSLFTLPVRETSMDLLGDFVNDYPQWAQALERVDHAYYQPISEEWGFGRWVLQDAILRLFAAEEEQVTSILAQLDETILELDGDIYDE